MWLTWSPPDAVTARCADNQSACVQVLAQWWVLINANQQPDAEHQVDRDTSVSLQARRRDRSVALHMNTTASHFGSIVSTFAQAPPEPAIQHGFDKQLLEYIVTRFNRLQANVHTTMWHRKWLACGRVHRPMSQLRSSGEYWRAVGRKKCFFMGMSSCDRWRYY